MFKLFSIQEANKLIPVVDGFLGDMQGAVQETLRLRSELANLDPISVEARNKTQELGFLVRVIQDNKLELDRLGVFVQDVNSGSIDFPSQVAGEVVCLSWVKGEHAITHYHRLNERTRFPLQS